MTVTTLTTKLQPADEGYKIVPFKLVATVQTNRAVFEERSFLKLTYLLFIVLGYSFAMLRIAAELPRAKPPNGGARETSHK